MKIDLTDTTVGGPKNEPLPAGRYTFVVNKAEFGKSPTKGTPQLSIFSEVSNGALRGKKRIFNIYLTESAKWKLKEFLLACKYSKANQSFEVDDLVDDLNSANPQFSAYVEVDGDYNEFSGFTEVEEEEYPEPDNSDLPY